MKLNPFRWLNEHPKTRVIGGWLTLAILVLLSWAGGPSLPIGPLYILPVMLLSYDVKLGRGLLIAGIAGIAWTILATNIGTSLWDIWTTEAQAETVHVVVPAEKPLPAAEAVEPAPAQARTKRINKWLTLQTVNDPIQQIPLVLTIWAMGTMGFVFVAVGFHTIRAQEHELAKAEADRVRREKEILNAITTTLNHEINNPLAIIAAQTGLMEIEGGKGNAQAKSLRNIQNAVERISSFVKELSAIEQVRLKSMGSSLVHIELDQNSQDAPARTETSTKS